MSITNRLSRLAPLMSAAALLLVVAPHAHAQSAMASHDGMAHHVVNTTDAGVAIHGYDPVAYFTAGAPTKGNASYTATYEGAMYQFASEANRGLFLANPSKYAPEYGGYCAMGMTAGAKFDIDPTAWRVENDKLYLNKDPKTQTMWLRDVPGNIVKADKKWPAVLMAKP